MLWEMMSTTPTPPAESQGHPTPARDHGRAIAAVAGLLIVLGAAWAVGSRTGSDEPPADPAGDSGAVADVRAERLAGSGRVGTSVAISRDAYPDGADRVFLARADVFADAVAAGPLTGGPVLLVPGCGDVPEATTAEIRRLDPSEVTALGGSGAVCDETLAAAAADRATSRLAGGGRMDTAVAISQAQFPSGADEVYLASADDSPDAVAGGVLTRGPVLLVDSTGPATEAVTAEIDRLDPGRVVALGGGGTVSGAVLAGHAGERPTGRLAGPARVETAVRISAYQFGAGSPVGASADTVYLARADVFADAVAGGSLADGPILLVPSCGAVPQAVSREVTRLAPDRIAALGGTAAVCDELLDEVVARARPRAAPPTPQSPGAADDADEP